jgi:hypothetical protein
MVLEMIQAGKAGLVEQSSAVAKSLKTKAKGTSDCYSKRGTLMTCLLKKRRAEKQLFAKAQKGKRQPAKESPTVKERRLL